MKYVRIMLATIGLIAVSGATHAERADANRTTLYTSATHAGKFDCNVVNVSQKPLNITISIINREGQVLSEAGPITTLPFVEVSNDFTGTNDAYCAIYISGTGDRNDVRAALNTNIARTFSVEGDATIYPTFVAKVLEAH
jgi:hypothetical protein